MEVFISGLILSGPSMKHGQVKIDPTFQIWSLPQHVPRLSKIDEF